MICVGNTNGVECRDTIKKCYCNVSSLVQGTTCEIGAFTYTYKKKASATAWTNITDDGWGVKLTNKNSTAPVTDTMCAYINDKPLVNTMHAFTSSKATSIDVSNYYMKNVNQMTYMFNKAAATEIIGISNFGQINAANIGGMFAEMPNIRVLDLTGWDTSNVTNFNYLFRKASSLETIYASTSFVTNLSGQTGSNVFSDCNSLVGGAGTLYNTSYTNKTYARIDGLNGLPGYFTEGPTPTN